MSIENIVPIEKILAEQGIFMGQFKGVSMRPLLKQGRDTVVIEPFAAAGPVQPGDIVLYRSDAGKYVLHRVIRQEGDAEYVFLGDNCVTLEHVRKEQLLGKLTAFYRDGRKYTGEELRFRVYELLWCRPWKARILLLKAKNRIRRVLRHGS